jgi:hypothetical protein
MSAPLIILTVCLSDVNKVFDAKQKYLTSINTKKHTHTSFLYNFTKYSSWWLSDVALSRTINTDIHYANFTTTAITDITTTYFTLTCTFS